MTEKRRTLLLGGVCATVLLIAALRLTPTLFTNFRPEQGVAPSREVAGTTSPTPATASEEGRSASDAALGAEIARELDEGDFASARWGVFVVSLRGGRVLYARNADRLFTPASNMKLYTTAVALDLLGADYRWRTSVYASAKPDASGTIRGDIILYGRGAPDLASRTREGASQAHLSALADDLYGRGVRRVRGDVVGDESYFQGERLGDGWLWQDVQWYYGAEPSALSIDDNQITLTIAPSSREGEPAEVKVVPSTDYVRLTNDSKTVARGERPTIGVTRGLSSNEVRVWGDFPVGSSPLSVRLSVHGPAAWAAFRFREALRARGIAVEGEARSTDGRLPEGARFDPERSVELAHVVSRPLGEVVREINKESLNLQAELLLRTLGRERESVVTEPDPQKTRERNVDQAGVAVIRAWLEQSGVQSEKLALHDGSGLSRLNLVTPEATVRLLVRMAQSPRADLFRDSLPTPGRGGTLRFRLRGAAAEGKPGIAAKTGSLTYVESLSGYATTADGEPLVFSIICNDETDPAPGARVIDRIVTLLARYPHSKS